MPRRVRLATLLTLCLNGILILTARYRFSYDAYTHMLFADHYRNDWWSLWDTRWYAGFSVNSYPPLVHQVIGLIGRITGVDVAYAIVLLAVLAAYPLAIYAFSRIFVGRLPAEYAALGGAFLPSIYLSAYTFGQLPTLTSTLLSLFCAAVLAEFLMKGSRLSGALAVMLIATIMGAHHATLLFLPWLIAAVGLHLLLNRKVHWQKLLARLAVFGLLATLAGLLVIWPFWRWGMGQAMQTPIDHATRHNYFRDMPAAFLFFWSVYGPLVAIIPFAFWKIMDRRFLGPAAAFGILFLLGLGGTTPLPRWLFGSGWEWLTYDRFALWASLFLLLFFGVLVVLAQRKLQPFVDRTSRLLGAMTKPIGSEKSSPIPTPLFRYWPVMAIFPLLAGTSLLVSLYPSILPVQPKPVNMQPIVDFLAQDDHSKWRYLTFGFGDQFAYLNRLTTATTIDGSYHTARTLPELRSSGIASIDSVFWLTKDLTVLDPILHIAGKYGVRWGFVDETRYAPVLLRNGWVKRAILSNGIQVWENPEAVLPSLSAQPEGDLLESFSWGTLPLLALAVTAALSGLRLQPEFARRLLLKAHTVAVGLLPVALMFWTFRPLTTITYPRVYFTYDNALFYLSDAIAVIAVLAWGLARGFAPPNSEKDRSQGRFFSLRRSLHSIVPWIFAFCVLASLSILWSKDWRVSLYLCLHLWLGFGLFLSLRDRPETWHSITYGFCVALALQVFFGFFEFAVQSTHLLAPLKMIWPGVLDPSTPGASVVQLVDGTRWLRAYGTLPHPNILGTFVVALLAGPATLFLADHKPHIGAILLFSAGIALIIITFSRGAWIGLFASGLLLLLKFRKFNSRRLLVLGIFAAFSLAATVLPLNSLIFTRLSAPSSVPTEAFSIKGRAWLVDQAVAAIQQHSLLGIGIGSFVLDLTQHASVGYIIEPAHNLSLLVFSELGIGGALILIGLCFVISRAIWQSRRPNAVLLSAVLVGLGVTSMFDHSLWTLAPSRILLALILGLWAGQVEHAEP